MRRALLVVAATLELFVVMFIAPMYLHGLLVASSPGPGGAQSGATAEQIWTTLHVVGAGVILLLALTLVVPLAAPGSVLRWLQLVGLDGMIVLNVDQAWSLLRLMLDDTSMAGPWLSAGFALAVAVAVLALVEATVSLRPKQVEPTA